jgi:hypothetical protein
MLPIKKIYIDSRHSTAESVNSSNFKIELPYSYKMPSDTVFFITDVCIPHSWMTVEKDINNRIYFEINIMDNITYYIATMNEGVYDGEEYATELNAAITSVNSSVVTLYTSANNKLTISITSMPNAYLKIFTDTEIPIINNYLVENNINWVGWQGYSGGEPGSINDNISNLTPLRPSNVYTCNFLNLQMVNNVYITSPNLGSFDTISSFSHNIIKKVPVTANYGYMIYDPYMTTNDLLDCSNQTLKTIIEFHIRDGRGRYINLHNAHITFSIIFNKYNLNQ